MSRRRAAGLAAALAVAVLTVATPAQAHDGRHDFESLIEEVTPIRLGAGIEIRMIDYDERIELVNRSGETVIVEGYEGEPYARVESGGPVSLNLRSPSLAASNDRWGRTPPGGREDADAPPRWVQVGGDGTLSWFDRRSHYRQTGVPDAVADPTVRQKLWDYRIPLRVGGETAAITGTLYWTGRRPFPIAAFVALLVATAACGLFGARVMKRLRATADPAGDTP